MLSPLFDERNQSDANESQRTKQDRVKKSFDEREGKDAFAIAEKRSGIDFFFVVVVVVVSSLSDSRISIERLAHLLSCRHSLDFFFSSSRIDKENE